MSPDAFIHARAAGTSLVLDCRGPRLPRVLHWGRDLGEVTDGELDQLAGGLIGQVVSNSMDSPVPFSLIPEQSAGWLGTPGLAAHRSGQEFSAQFTVQSIDQSGEWGEHQSIRVHARDARAQLSLVIDVKLESGGLLRQQAKLVNQGSGGLSVESLLLSLPVPQAAQEILDLTGRHLRERSPQRHAFTLGTHLRENRRGRTGTDASLVLVAGEPGFGFRQGQVWGMHVGWSGNHRTLAEATPSGVRLLAGGELLLPGEIHLPPDGVHTSPWVYFSHGDGLDELSARFHRYVRGLDVYPASERPVTLNTWEAVYFDHDLGRLLNLADRAATLGVERFVLDDGWFRARDDDTAGLGDWYVDAEAWPDGLHPLANAVVAHGMEFGLWVEPEMVNLDSDLARAHPDWILSTGGRLPPASRNQQVLDVAHPEAHRYLLERLDALLAEYPISYLKWDHNRDLVDAGTSVSGTASVHEQTLAVYALMDELLLRYPGLEIESCSSGGGRVDLGVLERTHRIWASDCIDPLERQQNQRWTGLLVPPELMGSHVAFPPTAHTTGRSHTLDSWWYGVLRTPGDRVGHFDRDGRRAGAAGRWIAAHKALRALLHSGEVVRADHPDPALWVHGVVSDDRSEALYSVVQMATSVHSPPGPIRLPGLDENATYHVSAREPGAAADGPVLGPPIWWEKGVTLPGRLLGGVGIQAPVLYPERLVLLEARRVSPQDS